MMAKNRNLQEKISPTLIVNIESTDINIKLNQIKWGGPLLKSNKLVFYIHILQRGYQCHLLIE